MIGGLHVLRQAVLAERAGTAGIEAAATQRVVFAGGNRIRQLLGALDHRQDDALRAAIEQAQQGFRVEIGDPHQWREVVALCHADHVFHGFRVDQDVFHVDDHEVEPGFGDQLDGGRSRDRTDHPVRRLSVGNSAFECIGPQHHCGL